MCDDSEKMAQKNIILPGPGKFPKEKIGALTRYLLPWDKEIGTQSRKAFWDAAV